MSEVTSVQGHATGVLVLVSVVTVDPAGWYPFTVAKVTAVGLAMVLVWWVAYRRRGAWRLDVRIRSAWWALLGLLVVAAAFARDPWYAWIGTPERSMGLVTWAGFAAAAYAGSRSTVGDRTVTARWVVVAGLAAGSYGVVERFWGAPIEMATTTSRLTGTYGSAAFLAAAMCLLMPISAGVAADPGHPVVWRGAAIGSVALGAFTLVGTGTRAGWVGCAVGVVVWTAARWRRFPGWGRPAGYTLGAVVVGIGAGWVSGRDLSDRVSGGASSRWAEWQVGWGIVRSNPVLGVGPEGYRTALADGVSAAYERNYGRAVTPDRAHHVLLDVAAAGGVAAAVAYGVIVVVVVLGAWRWMRDRGAVEAGIAVALVAYSAQQMFLFPVAVIDPIWWVFAGAVVAVPASIPVASPVLLSWKRSTLRQRAPMFVATLVAVLIAAAGVLGLAADRLAKDALAGPGARAAAERAVELRPDVVRYRLLAADAATRTPTIAGIRTALGHTETALDVSPHDPIVLLADANYASLLAQTTGDPGDVADSLRRWSSLAAADRNCFACHLGLGYAAALAGDRDVALEAFGRAEHLARPGDAEPATAIERLTQP